jgi:hypothetical protein
MRVNAFRLAGRAAFFWRPAQVLGVVAIAALSWTASASSAAAATGCGRICTLTIYYSSPKKTKIVGEFSDCPGGVRKGRITAYFKAISAATGTCGGTTEDPPTCEMIDGVLACTRHPLR